VPEDTFEPSLRESNLRWDETGDSSGPETESHLTSIAQTGFSTVVAPQRAKLSDVIANFRDSMKERFSAALKTNYANCFHHNRLIAKVAEWTVGITMGILHRMGIDPAQTDAMLAEIKDDLSQKNEDGMAQVFYDETMLEIVA